MQIVFANAQFRLVDINAHCLDCETFAAMNLMLSVLDYGLSERVSLTSSDPMFRIVWKSGLYSSTAAALELPAKITSTVCGGWRDDDGDNGKKKSWFNSISSLYSSSATMLVFVSFFLHDFSSHFEDLICVKCCHCATTPPWEQSITM